MRAGIILASTANAWILYTANIDLLAFLSSEAEWTCALGRTTGIGAFTSILA
jgi:hypothetical protein